MRVFIECLATNIYQGETATGERPFLPLGLRLLHWKYWVSWGGMPSGQSLSLYSLTNFAIEGMVGFFPFNPN